MKWNVSKTFISLCLTLFFLSSLFAVCDSNDSLASSDVIFQDGKKEFFKELKLKFGLHPLKFRLLPESITKIENAETEIPFIYENLINITYLKEKPNFSELKDRKSQESMQRFRERFLNLSKKTASYFVDSLFPEPSAAKAVMQDVHSFFLDPHHRVPQ